MVKVSAEQEETPRGLGDSVQFHEVFEILEELNQQADRLRRATEAAMSYRNSEGGGPDADADD